MSCNRSRTNTIAQYAMDEPITITNVRLLNSFELRTDIRWYIHVPSTKSLHDWTAAVQHLSKASINTEEAGQHGSGLIFSPSLLAHTAISVNSFNLVPLLLYQWILIRKTSIYSNFDYKPIVALVCKLKESCMCFIGTR